MNKSLGFGLGLRHPHFDDIVNEWPTDIDWFEILTEDYLIEGGPLLQTLDKIAERYPLVMHGVSLSIGSVDPINWDYLKKVKKLSERVNACWISDHFCWTGVDGVNLHDLMPLPTTAEAIEHLVPRIQAVQEFLGQKILLENPSTYVAFESDQMPEWEFVNAVSKQTGCNLLLDINNIYVSSVNQGFDAESYIDAIDAAAVKQIHLAGHETHANYLIDTHDHPIIEPVYELYSHARKRLGDVATMIERDDNIPPLAELREELALVREVAEASDEVCA